MLLTQADTDLLMLGQARALLPALFAPLRAAHIGIEDEAAVGRLLDDLLPGAAIVVLRLLGGARSFAAPRRSGPRSTCSKSDAST